MAPSTITRSNLARCRPQTTGRQADQAQTRRLGNGINTDPGDVKRGTLGKSAEVIEIIRIIRTRHVAQQYVISPRTQSICNIRGRGRVRTGNRGPAVVGVDVGNDVRDFGCVWARDGSTIDFYIEGGRYKKRAPEIRFLTLPQIDRQMSPKK
jgi:hypothetical protein